jgi:hypothetical protein
MKKWLMFATILVAFPAYAAPLPDIVCQPPRHKVCTLNSDMTRDCVCQDNGSGDVGGNLGNAGGGGGKPIVDGGGKPGDGDGSKPVVNPHDGGGGDGGGGPGNPGNDNPVGQAGETPNGKGGWGGGSQGQGDTHGHK